MSRTEPTEWAKFCKLSKLYPFADFSLPSTTVIGQANRYRARFSLVSDVNRVEINHCNDDTIRWIYTTNESCYGLGDRRVFFQS